MGRRLSNPTILEANLFYLIIATLLIFLGSMAQQKDLISGLIITEYFIILFPTVLFLVARNHVVKGQSLKRVLRLNRISFKQVIMIPIITILTYPIAVFLNYIGILIISRFGEIRPSPIPIPETGSELILSLLVIAVSAGICEEVMFRGLMLNAYEVLGKKKAIMISAILFGVFHFNPQNLIGPIFLGLIFGVLLLKTNSIFSVMIAHTTNNAIALLIGMGLSKFQNINVEQSMEALEELNNLPIATQLMSFLIPIIFWGGIVAGCGFAVYFLIKALPGSSNDDEKLDSNAYNYEASKTTRNLSKLHVALSIIPIVIVAIAYVWLGYYIVTL